MSPNTRAVRLDALIAEIRACAACADAFAATPTAHAPRPLLRASSTARIGVAAQAPGRLAHERGLSFDDPSGDRLRRWMGVDRETFYDARRIAILPMGFCFPGHDAKGGDRPPEPRCAELWRARLMALHPQLELLLVIGSYALRWHLGAEGRRPMTELARAWRDRLASSSRPIVFPLPHPSWRNTAWLQRNPWFEAEAAPELREHIARWL